MLGVLSARAQAPIVVEPLSSAPRVVVHGTGSAFDLAHHGPHFTESWLSAALPMLARQHDAPALLQRVTIASRMEASDDQVRTTYDRAADGRLLERQVERRQQTAWVPAQRTRYTYQGGVLVAQHTDVWMDGTWHPDQHIILQRTPDGAVHTVTQDVWRDGQWLKATRLAMLPAADTSGAQAADAVAQRRLVRSTWVDSTWTPTTRITFTTAEEGRLVTQHNETWTGAEWVNSVRITYMYDGAGYPIEKSLAVWVGEAWADGPLHLYDYHVRGQRVEQRTETWIGSRRIRTERVQLTYAAPIEEPLLGSASFD